MSDTDIFISYSREDRAKARTVARCLEREGLSVWWDAALHSGDSFDVVIERQLREAKAVIVLWSPKSVKSRWVRAEANSADKAGKLAPVIIEACDRPIIFELMHTVDLSQWNGDTSDPGWTQFLLDLHRIMKKSQLTASAEAVPPKEKAAVPPSAFSFAATRLADDTAQDESFEATQFGILIKDSPTQAHCLALTIDGKAEKQFVVGPLGLRIGRGTPAEVILPDPQVSRRHCRVELAGNELVVVDLGSTNGTFVDGERIEEQAILPVGSILTVGSCRLVHETRTSATV